MKHLLFAVLENTKDTHDLIHDLSKLGYNGTVIPSKSLKHVLQDADEDLPSFISLSHIHSNNLSVNTTIYFILDDDKLSEVQDMIKRYTKSFSSTKGGMFAIPLESYEGSF